MIILILLFLVFTIVCSASGVLIAQSLRALMRYRIHFLAKAFFILLHIIFILFYSCCLSGLINLYDEGIFFAGLITGLTLYILIIIMLTTILTIVCNDYIIRLTVYILIALVTSIIVGYYSLDGNEAHAGVFALFFFYSLCFLTIVYRTVVIIFSYVFMR